MQKMDELIRIVMGTVHDLKVERLTVLGGVGAGTPSNGALARRRWTWAAWRAASSAPTSSSRRPPAWTSWAPSRAAWPGPRPPLRIPARTAPDARKGG